MATKRIVTKIGNVFCVEMDGRYKCFFQYIANDIEQLNSSVIRVFRKRYPMDYKPDMDEIVAGEVAFYAHTILRAGIANGIWYKVGKTSEIGQKELEDVIFGTNGKERYGVQGDVDPRENWRIWDLNGHELRHTRLPESIKENVEVGCVLSYLCILDRIRYGYYASTMWEYLDIKRIPWEDADSFVKIENGSEVTYLHFIGENAVREVIVSPNGKIKLSTRCPEEADNHLRKAKFWETFWMYRNFISKHEFDRVWYNYDALDIFIRS